MSKEKLKLFIGGTLVLKSKDQVCVIGEDLNLYWAEWRSEYSQFDIGQIVQVCYNPGLIPEVLYIYEDNQSAEVDSDDGELGN